MTLDRWLVVAGSTTFQSSSSGANVHEQILTLAARPYGDWPLFKDLVPKPTTSAEDVLKPTNPAAVNAVLDSSGYRVTSPDSSRLKLHPRTNHHDKKSLFDGLEESDASLEDKLSLKPSRKRLVLRPQQSRNVEENNSSAPGHTASPGHRSLEDASLTKEPSGATERPTSASETQEQRAKPFEDVRGINTDLEESSERHNSWLSSSKLPWNDSKEKPVDNQPTPRLYPDLAAEQLAESDRRASWLTTKPLRKKTTASEPDDRSVRELRTERGGDKENEERLSGE
ncbi:hypothetical protein JYU34_008195 [Plutella xylostella]|uniref:Uncharacterized protein n=1 Tax=Plutella xylostella TaxID=51655 RepID=A0ABQ7QNZ4_PLUXY|nr:hypothetical protein JYU34_008195 [Plutella xylostella]